MPFLPGHHHSPRRAAETSGAGRALRACRHAALARAALSRGQRGLPTLREWGLPVQVSRASVVTWVWAEHPVSKTGEEGPHGGRWPPKPLLLPQAYPSHQGSHGVRGEAVREGAADTAADAAEEEQVRGPGECHAAFLGQSRVSGGRTLLTKSLPLSSQGNQLRKMLLQNYLQNRKSGPRGELTDPTGSGQCHGPALPRLAWLALASNRCLSHAASP